MTKKKNVNFISDWSDVIRNTKIKVERYYLKEDVDKQQPYKVWDVKKHFNSDELFVHFSPLLTDEPTDYVLEKDEFLKRFIRVVEES